MADAHLISAFQLQIEEAVKLVHTMSTEQKLKAVQFWNHVSENLQKMVNNSADDIYALAKQRSAQITDCNAPKMISTCQQPGMDPTPHLQRRTSQVSSQNSEELSSPTDVPDSILHSRPLSMIGQLDDAYSFYPETAAASAGALPDLELNSNGGRSLLMETPVGHQLHYHRSQPASTVLTGTGSECIVPVCGDDFNRLLSADSSPVLTHPSTNVTTTTGAVTPLNHHHRLLPVDSRDLFDIPFSSLDDHRSDHLPGVNVGGPTSAAETARCALIKSNKEFLSSGITDFISGINSSAARSPESTNIPIDQDLRHVVAPDLTSAGYCKSPVDRCSEEILANEGDSDDWDTSSCMLTEDMTLTSSTTASIVVSGDPNSGQLQSTSGLRFPSRGANQHDNMLRDSAVFPSNGVTDAVTGELNKSQDFSAITNGEDKRFIDQFTECSRTDTSKNGSVDSTSCRCDVCGAVSNSRQAFYKHYASSHTDNPVCVECGLILERQNQLLEHLQRAHGDKQCSLKTELKSSEVSTGRLHVCLTCCRQFSSRSNLVRHNRLHTGERPFVCDQCPKRFSEKKSLEVHSRLHSGDRPFACTMCPARFKQLGNLNSHMSCHKDRRPHLCDLCGKRFRQRSQLLQHKQRHEDKKAFKCDQCELAFNVTNDLLRHKRCHLEKKPFSCDVCQKTFSRHEALGEHLNRHFGHRPFSCRYCSRTFSELSACRRHIKKHQTAAVGGDAKSSVIVRQNVTAGVTEEAPPTGHEL